MTHQPTIPFGYRRVTGQLQKGDGIWNGKRFAKVKKAYPNTEYVEIFAIRKCVVEQQELPGIVGELMPVMEVE